VILGGDVGGTKCNLALFDQRAGALVEGPSRRYPSEGYPRFEDVVAEFLHSVVEPAGIKVSAAGFGVAGPVSGGISVATNLPGGWIRKAWQRCSASLASRW